MSISFACRHCGKAIKCKESLSGKPANCPACGERITVPPLRVIPTAAEVGAVAGSASPATPPPEFDDSLFEPENVVPEYQPTSAPRRAGPVAVPQQFRALRLVADCYRWAGIIEAAVTACGVAGLVLLKLVSPEAPAADTSVVAIVAIGIGGAVAAVTSFACGELIMLAIGFEESARASRELLQKIHDSAASR